MYSEPERFPVSVDVAALTVREGALGVLLVTRKYPPHAGRLALPGGFIRGDEDLETAARRELAEETGIAKPPGHLEQLRSYGAPDRDPRGRIVTIAHVLFAPGFGVPRGGSDAAQAQWYRVEDLAAGDLAFDHDRILADAVERARSKLEYSALATAFCPPEFTIAQLRAVYEAVWGVALDPRNFHRKATGTPGFLEATGDHSAEGPGRPAALFRTVHPIGDMPDGSASCVSASGAVLNPPLLRPGGGA